MDILTVIHLLTLRTEIERNYSVRYGGISRPKYLHLLQVVRLAEYVKTNVATDWCETCNSLHDLRTHRRRRINVVVNYKSQSPFCEK